MHTLRQLLDSQTLNQQSMTAYRAEIDGLRALAVIAVIVNHVNKGLLPSGYLGVDIFFVISGYVITSSMSRRSSEYFWEFLISFYERRVKRLLPALAVFVLVLSLMVHLIVQNAGRYYVTGALSLFGLSNIYIYSALGSYWGFDSMMNPFTQTWSLGVEEQFYIAFPVLAWVTGYVRSSSNGFKNFLFCIQALAVMSLAGFIYWNYVNESAAYFLTPFRFWELAAGSMLFIYIQRGIVVNKILSLIPPLLIIGAIFLVMLVVPSDLIATSCPVVVLLTCLLLLSLRQETFAWKILSHKYFVYVGLLSYSLYLWHWGLLSIARWTVGVNRYSLLPILIAISAFSIISYEFIEKPARKNIWSASKVATIAKGFAAAGLVAAFSLMLGSYFRAKWYLGNNRSVNPPSNILPSGSFYVVGDSHANDIYNLLLNNGTFNVHDWTKGGCKFYEHNSENCGIKPYSQSSNINSASRGDIVILASNYLPYLSTNPGEMPKIQEYFEEYVSPLISRGVLVVLKLPHPEVNAPKVPKGIICKKEVFRPWLNESCFVEGVSKNDYLVSAKKYLEPLIDFLDEKYPEVLLWDVSDVTCPGDECFPVTEDAQYLRDHSHLFFSSALLSDNLVNSLNSLLKTANLRPSEY